MWRSDRADLKPSLNRLVHIAGATKRRAGGCLPRRPGARGRRGYRAPRTSRSRVPSNGSYAAADCTSESSGMGHSDGLPVRRSCAVLGASALRAGQQTGAVC